MPVSSKRRRNGKLKKRAVQQFIPLNKGKEKLQEIKDMYTDEKRLGIIKKLKESFVLQKGNAATAAGKCIERFTEEGKEVRNKLEVVTSITLERTKTHVKGLSSNVQKLQNIAKSAKKPVQALVNRHKYDYQMLLKESKRVLKDIQFMPPTGNPIKYYLGNKATFKLTP